MRAEHNKAIEEAQLRQEEKLKFIEKEKQKLIEEKTKTIELEKQKQNKLH